MIGLPDGRVLGKGRSDHKQDAVLHAISAAGLTVVPLSEWVVSWPSSPTLRNDLKEATLYVTMEPSNDRQGDMAPSLTQLIAQCGLTRVVIGCADPVPEKATEGAAALHKAGLQVILGLEEETCQDLIQEYSHLANSKLQKFARRHFARTGQVSTFNKEVVNRNQLYGRFDGRGTKQTCSITVPARTFDNKTTEAAFFLTLRLPHKSIVTPYLPSPLVSCTVPS